MLEFQEFLSIVNSLFSSDLAKEYFRNTRYAKTKSRHVKLLE